MDDTIAEIVESSTLPISIIIVGVGSADFSNMSILDGDENKLRDKRNRQQVRDNVQFVSFNKCRANPDMLKNEVLMELPDQIEQ